MQRAESVGKDVRPCTKVPAVVHGRTEYLGFSEGDGSGKVEKRDVRWVLEN